jgi:hypothetical protein
VAAKVWCADDLLTEKNCLFPSKPEYFRLHRKRENMRKKPRHPKMTRLSWWLRRQQVNLLPPVMSN